MLFIILIMIFVDPYLDGHWFGLSEKFILSKQVFDHILIIIVSMSLILVARYVDDQVVYNSHIPCIRDMVKC